MATDTPWADLVYSVLNAAHEQAAQYPVRTAVYDGKGAFAASTRHGSPAYPVSRARNSGTLANALTRSAHPHDRHIPLRDRTKDYR